ncbi:MAG: DUF2799 domain-containing protein [Marinicaulis sp.]|nr:DUF2799 domain-containing protein [Marinicaulis sp.]NNE41418.1 DUF2799 domain-containing protein [Marinicaulis sp.]NNL89511.1 DUF2799 domain-containing protein [Marinicaulis sp.]
MRGSVIGISSMLLLGACAGGMSKEACLYADWRAIGYEDGARGFATSAVSSRRATCAKKAGVTVDMAAYMEGRDAGLREYCQPSNGFAAGARGGRYYGVCTGPVEAEFISAYQRGNQLFVLERDVSAAANELAHAEKHLAQLRHDIDHAELALISPATPHPKRVDILVDLKNMRNEHERVAASLGSLALNYERAQDELADYRAFLAAEGPYPGAAQGVTRAGY